MVFLMNGQIMDLVIRYVKEMLVRGSEEGFVIILSLLVVEELVNVRFLFLHPIVESKTKAVNQELFYEAKVPTLVRCNTI